MTSKQIWIILSASLAIVAGAITPWLLRSPQTDVVIAPAIVLELPVAEFADVERARPSTDLVGQQNLFHPGRGVVIDDAIPSDPIPPPAATNELKLALQSIGRINNLACASITVGTASQVVPVGKRVTGTDWRLEAVHDRSARLRDGDRTLTLTVGAGR
jgi:hypothetical protein